MTRLHLLFYALGASLSLAVLAAAGLASVRAGRIKSKRQGPFGASEILIGLAMGLLFANITVGSLAGVISMAFPHMYASAEGKVAEASKVPLMLFGKRSILVKAMIDRGQDRIGPVFMAASSYNFHIGETVKLWPAANPVCASPADFFDSGKNSPQVYLNFVYLLLPLAALGIMIAVGWHGRSQFWGISKKDTGGFE